jgi:hypothetical protein
VSSHVESRPLSPAELVAATQRPIPRALFQICAVLAVIGLVVFVIGAATGESRAWHAMLFNWMYFTLISSAGVVFVAVQRITTARWSRQIIRLLEGYVAFIPLSFLLLVLMLTVGKDHIFPWAAEAPHIPEKALWLSPTFLVLRDIIGFAIIAWLSIWYIYTSLRLDVGQLPEWGALWAKGLRERMRRGYRDERREIHSTHSLQGKLAVFLVLAFAYIWSVLVWDLSMSLDVHFQSTLYGWWVFMGGWLGAIMSFTVITLWWRKFLGAYDLIVERHFHDLGKLCFAFTAFWGYLTFGQYLVIWYGNLAEETHWMRQRLMSPWKTLTLMVVYLMFVLPFPGLISKAAKMFYPTLTLFALCSIFGLWLHRYLEVYPSVYHDATSLPFGLWEVGIALGFLGAWGLCYCSFMNAFPRIRVTLITSPHRDEVQIPVNPETMEPLPAHE